MSADRERLLQDWVEAIMRRSPLDRLAERPLSELVDQLRTLLDVVEGSSPLPQTSRPEWAAGGSEGDLEPEVERALAGYERFGHRFSVLMLAIDVRREAAPVGPGTFATTRVDSVRRAYAADLTTRTRMVDRVLDGGHGRIAVLLASAGPEEAREAGRRLADAAAGDAAGVETGWAVVSCPEDGLTSQGLIALAKRRLDDQAAQAEPGAERRASA